MAQNWKKYPYDHLEFGETVKMYRTALEWSLGDLSLRTGINKGTLHQIEEGIRSVPEKDRDRLVEVLSEALEATNKHFDRCKFLTLAGLGTAGQHNSTPSLLGYRHVLLDLAESQFSVLRHDLYRGRASFVEGEAKRWYSNLTSADLPETDRELAIWQLRFGILLGQAQEAVYPWDQRRTIAIQTYNDVDERIFQRFELKTFQADYAMLHALRAPLYREMGEFEKR